MSRRVIRDPTRQLTRNNEPRVNLNVYLRSFVNFEATIKATIDLLFEYFKINCKKLNFKIKL